MLAIEIKSSLIDALEISGFVFAMMILVDFADALTAGRLGRMIKGGRARQYAAASFLGATPGCLGAFLNVSFYLRGLITFGAITGGMVATSGDAAFVMLATFPGKAIVLFLVLFIIGIIWAPIVDGLVGRFRINTCRECRESTSHKEECRTFKHYIKEHVWGHIIKKHIWKIFFWCLAALLFVNVGLGYLNLEGFISTHTIWIILIAALFGLIPESGPQIIFVMMFAKGLVPFSVLLTSSIVQDGHGILPLLSHSIKDSVIIKALNLILGLAVGVVLYLIGI